MEVLNIITLFAVLKLGSAAPTSSSSDEGVSPFWTDDYKVFDQIYGRTSDRDLYGKALPKDPFNIELKKIKKSSVPVKYAQFDASAEGSQINPYSIGEENYSKLLDKYRGLKPEDTTQKIRLNKRPQPSIASSDLYHNFKPITEQSDPGAYDYFRHLEHLGALQSLDFDESQGSFRPVKTRYQTHNPNELEGYKSIHEIIQSQENSEDTSSFEPQPRPKGYKSKRIPHENRPSYKFNTKSEKPYKYIHSNHIHRPSGCSSGRCKKRSPSPYSYPRKPVLRRLKQKRIVTVKV